MEFLAGETMKINFDFFQLFNLWSFYFVWIFEIWYSFSLCLSLSPSLSVSVSHSLTLSLPFSLSLSLSLFLSFGERKNRLRLRLSSPPFEKEMKYSFWNLWATISSLNIKTNGVAVLELLTPLLITSSGQFSSLVLSNFY